MNLSQFNPGFVNFALRDSTNSVSWRPGWGRRRGCHASETHSRRLLLFVSVFTGFGASSATAADLIWQVENPFRFFKGTRSFAMHEAAFNAVRGNGALPADIDLAHRAQAQRSGLQGFLVARSLRRDRRPALPAEPARLGRADAQRQLLRGERQAAPLFADLRAQVFLGHGEGGLRPARGAHRHHPDRAEQLAGVTGDCAWTWQPRKPAARSRPRRSPARTS